MSHFSLFIENKQRNKRKEPTAADDILALL
jgi:hypothetical protein